MKKLKSLGVVAAATILLTSCLDGSNESSVAGCAVIDISTEAGIAAYVDDYSIPCYSPAFKDLTPGDCIYFTGTLNGDDLANDGTKKYWTISNAAVTQKFDSRGRFAMPLDTANIIPNEIAATDMALLYFGQYSFTIKDYLFVGSSHEKAPSDQVNEYQLQYDYNQEPQTVDGKRVYDFFLRVVKTSDGKGIVGTTPFYYTFNTRGYFKTLQSKETAAGNETLSIRFNYIKEFNKDTTAATWGKSQIITIQIPKES